MTISQVQIQLAAVSRRGAIWDHCYFLLYINDLPNCLHWAIPRMFADDTSVCYAAKSMDELQSVINSELVNLHKWLNTNKLNIETLFAVHLNVSLRLDRISSLNFDQKC